MTARVTSWVVIVLCATAVVLWVLSDDGLGSTSLTPGETEARPHDSIRQRIAEQVDSARREETADDPGTSDASFQPVSVRKALARFTGRLVYSDRGAAAGVSVCLLRFESGLMSQVLRIARDTAQPPELRVARVRSDASGRFVIAGMWPSGNYYLRAGAGTETVATRMLPQTPGPGETIDVGDIVLRAGATISGVVVDEDGRPIAGALVRAADVPQQLIGYMAVERFRPDRAILYVKGDVKHVIELPDAVRESFESLAIPQAVSLADGSFRLRSVEPGHAIVMVTRDQRRAFVSPRLAVRPGKRRDLGRVELGVGQTVHGQVLDPSGHAVAGAEVLVAPVTASSPYAFAGELLATDANGSFHSSGLGPGDVVAAARRSARDPWFVTDQQSVTARLAIELPVRVQLTVAVSSTTGGALTSPRIELFPGAPGKEDADLALAGFRKPVARAPQQLDRGRFRFRDLPAGRYLVVVSASGHAPAAERVILTRDQQVEVVLPPSPGLEVLVTTDEGQPLAGARVTTESRGEFPRVPSRPVDWGTTGETGRMTIQPFATRRLLVRASHPAKGADQRLVEQGTRAVHLVLAETGSIQGRLTDNGDRPEPGRWSISARRVASAPESAYDKAPRLAEVASDGAFEFSGLTPGRYEVSAFESVERTNVLLAIDEPAFDKRLRGMRVTQTVSVLAGHAASARLDLSGVPKRYEGPTARVTGTVRVNGRPGRGLEVRGWHHRWLSARAAADGSFDLGPVPVGSVGLYVVDPSTLQRGGWEVLWWKRVGVSVEHETKLEIELELGGLSGQVVDAEGVAVPGCELIARGALVQRGSKGRDYAKFYGTTDRSGRFQFDNLPGGTYSVSVWNQRVGRGTIDDLEVTPRAVRDGIRLQLSRVHRITGRVRMSSFPSRPQWSWIVLYAKGPKGEYLSREWGAHVRSDGRFVIEGIPPATYELWIFAMFRKPGNELAWETRQYWHKELVEVSADIDGLVVEPGQRR